MGVVPEELHRPNLFLAWKAQGSTVHLQRSEALRQRVLVHETLTMAAWSVAIHRLALQVGLDDPAPDHKLEISRADELLKKNAWATKQSSCHHRARPCLGRDPAYPTQLLWHELPELREAKPLVGQLFGDL